MELANLNSEWADEQRRVFMKHADDPRYPKPLTLPELLAQVDKVPYAVLTERAGQFGGGGKLSSHFREYIRQCSCMCWSNWERAWEDFSHYMAFDTSLGRSIQESALNAVAKRPLNQMLRMFKEFMEDPSRLAVILRREGYSAHEWQYAVARLVDAGQVALDPEQAKLVLKSQEEATAL